MLARTSEEKDSFRKILMARTVLFHIIIDSTRRQDDLCPESSDLLPHHQPYYRLYHSQFLPT
jgi:hypothetical protein